MSGAEGANRTILVVGFNPFAGRKANAAGDIADAFDGQEFNDVEIRSVLLPVEWGKPEAVIKRAIEEIQEEGQQLVAILGLGECRGRRIRVEEKAHNQRAEGRADEANNKPGAGVGTEIIIGGPLKYSSPLARDVGRALQDAGVEFEKSEDAGRFLCEEAFYAGVHLTSRRAKVAGPVGFVHVPPYPVRDQDKSNYDNKEYLRRTKKSVQKILERLSKKTSRDAGRACA
jgi:pyrrolidone-carboxylate peptidase